MSDDGRLSAAVEAIEDAAMRWLGRDLGTIHRNDIVAEGLEAADEADAHMGIVRVDPSDPAVLEAAARALAEQYDDGCFDRVAQWESLPTDEANQDNPGSDYEDREFYVRIAAAVLAAITKETDR